ncbi:MAG: cyanophycinase [Isosphaeraceae bacterium]
MHALPLVGSWDRRAMGWAGFLAAAIALYLGTNLALRARSEGPPEWPAGDRGTLIICGGGGVPDPVKARFLKLAGGESARLVVIPTAGGWADEPGWDPADPWKKRGIRRVEVLHTRDRKRADDPSFYRPIDDATAVWISGGYQSWLSEAYVGTGVERALARLLQRGGVIGGTSAGASILSKVMMDGGRVEGEAGLGFDLAPGVVIDQHFLKRNRMKRLFRVLSEHDDLIGLGVDEETALEFDLSHNRLMAHGNSYALICIPPDRDPDGEPRIEVLKPGDEADLNRIRDRSAQAVVTRIAIEEL